MRNVLLYHLRPSDWHFMRVFFHGNSLSFVVLHKYTSENVGTHLLNVISVTDNMYPKKIIVGAMYANYS